MEFELENVDNYILPSGLAMVGGKVTGLAGCSDSERCARADQCLRADYALTYRVQLDTDVNTCRFLIPKRARI